MNYLLVVIVLYTSSLHALASNYYVDPSFTGSPNTGSLQNPWKSLSQVQLNMPLFTGGDTVFFKKGQSFIGNLIISESGIDQFRPLVFSTYGSSIQPPRFEYALPDAKTNESRKVIVLDQVSFVKIQGFKILDASLDTSDHSKLSKVGYGIYIYKGYSNSISDVEITAMGIGIAIESEKNLIYNCAIRNMHMIRSSASFNDDFGAVGILVMGSDNDIRNNYISKCWGTSIDYNYDGGAIEFFGPVSNNRIQYNTAIGNEGFIELGSNVGGVARDNMIAYNLLINNGRLFYFNMAGTFALQVQNLQFYNNNIVETALHYSQYPYLIGTDTEPAPSNVLNLKNNIFYISTPVSITNDGTQPFYNGQTHESNLYYLASGNVGYPLHTTERKVLTGINIFTDTTNTDPEQWNYNLLSISPAFETGQILGITKDYTNSDVPSGATTDMGILELYVNPLPIKFTSFYSIQKAEKRELYWKCEKSNGELLNFEVEQSFNGTDFLSLAIVAKQSSKTDLMYNYTDTAVREKMTYYRIRAVLQGQGTAYSQIIRTQLQKKEGKISIFPNPVVDYLYLRNYTGITGAHLLLINQNGQVVKELAIKKEEHQLDLTSFSPGIYQVQIVFKEGVIESYRIIKI